MATVFSGYYALGTGITNAGAFSEISGGSYARLAVSLTGNQLAGLTQAVGAFVAATTPTTGNIYKMAIFDSLTGGNLVAYWDLNPSFTATTTLFPALTINIVLNVQLQMAVNLAANASGPGTSGSFFDVGAQLGLVNGQPLIAGNRLAITPSGNLLVHQGEGQWFSSIDVQNNLSFGSLISGNILNSITATASGTQGTGVVLSGFYNRITTVASGNDACTLPSPALGGLVGTMLIVVNNASANTAYIFPDVGSQINILSANTQISLPVAKSCIFFRVSGLQWITIPTVPS